MTELVVAAVAFVHGGKVLTVRKEGTDRFMLVGGKIESGEDARAAAVREVGEEVGLDIERLELLGEFSAEAANEPGCTVHSTVFVADLPGVPVAGAEIAELRWSSLASSTHDLAPLLANHVLPALRLRSLA